MKRHFAITLFPSRRNASKTIAVFRHLVTLEHFADRSIDLHALLLCWRPLEEAAARGSGKSRHRLDRRSSRCNRALVVPRLSPAVDDPESAERPERKRLSSQCAASLQQYGLTWRPHVRCRSWRSPLDVRAEQKPRRSVQRLSIQQRI